MQKIKNQNNIGNKKEAKNEEPTTNGLTKVIKIDAARKQRGMTQKTKGGANMSFLP